MYTVIALPEFEDWLSNIKDRPTRIRLLRRLDKARRGLLGDVAPVGGGVLEMREYMALAGACTLRKKVTPWLSCSAGVTNRPKGKTLLVL